MRDFLYRVRTRGRLNLAALRETIIAVSERTSRKVQILSLHWQAVGIQGQINAVYQRAGATLVDAIDDGARLAADGILTSGSVEQKAHVILSGSTTTVSWLKRDLRQIEGLIRELEQETLYEDLLKLQQDLAMRGGTIRRVTLPSRSAMVGRPLTELRMPETVRIAAVLRGPVLLSSADTAPLLRNDTLVLVGPATDVQQAADALLERPRAAV